MYFLSFVTQVLPLRPFGSFPSPMSPSCLLRRMLCMVTGDLKCAGRAKLLTLEPYSTVWMEYSRFCWVKTFFFLFSFFFLRGGEGRQTEGQLLLVLNLEKALLYCSMFILHLKLHLTALLLSMYSQLPFMRHLSY